MFILKCVKILLFRRFVAKITAFCGSCIKIRKNMNFFAKRG